MSLSLLLVSLFTFVELNCENLFDCLHDSLKHDEEFMPESTHHWTRTRYWHKVNRIGQELLSCGGDKSVDWSLPDMVALCEVENDSVMRDLTKRSLLRKARYEYIMTDSPDERGIDVALLYSPFSFSLINHHSIRIPQKKDMRPTRDILYASGIVLSGDTLHVFVVHAPSRSGGEAASQPFRLHVANTLCAAIDSVRNLSPDAKIIVAGDFNDYATNKSLLLTREHGMTDISATASGDNGVKGTYKYHGDWGSLDHILVSENIAVTTDTCYIHSPKFLLTDDDKYGGVQPLRTYLGPRYINGFSDHLPLVARFKL